MIYRYIRFLWNRRTKSQTFLKIKKIQNKLVPADCFLAHKPSSVVVVILKLLNGFTIRC